MIHARFSALLTLCLLLFSASLAAAGPYDDFDALLKRYVDKEGLVDYATLKAKDEQTLKSVVAKLAKVDASKLEGAHKKAYWINVYNAVTLKAIVERYPIKSIKDLNRKGYDVWKDYRFGKKKRSLNDIEHKILRPMGDPRIHAAIVCASLGCPPLRPEAYLPDKLDAQLDDNVKVWLGSATRGVKIVGQTVHMSQIFNWFGKDFGDGSKAAHLRWIKRHAPEGIAAKVSAGMKVDYLNWGWALNERKR